jgi:hypothetical protein
MNKCGFDRPKLENESFIMVDSGKNRSQFLVYHFLYIYALAKMENALHSVYKLYYSITIYHCSHCSLIRSHEIIILDGTPSIFDAYFTMKISRKRDDKQRGYENPGLRLESDLPMAGPISQFIHLLVGAPLLY